MSILSKTSVQLMLCVCMACTAVANAQSPTDTQVPADTQLTDKEALTTASDILSRYEVGEELILSVQLDKRNIGEVFAVVQSNGIFIELDSLVNVLEFPITANNVGNQYEGWYIREQNKFKLQLADLQSPTTLSYELSTKQLSEQQIIVLYNIPYVHSSLILEVFKISVSLNPNRQQLILNPSVALPIQERLSRRNKDVRGKREDNVAKYPELFRGYEILSPQTFDLSTNLNYSENSGDARANFSLLGRREIAYISTRLFLSGTNNETLANARLNFSKQNINSPIMDRLGLTSVEFGDVTPTAVGNSSTGGQATGLVFTNRKNIRNDSQQNISIAGEVQNGWDVELFRNDILVGQLFDIQNGRYEFNDIQLFAGLNSFEIVRYGPQGEISRERLNRFLDGNASRNKNWQYNASITKPNSSLLDLDNFAENPNDSNLDMALSLNRNIFADTSVNIGFVNQLFDSGSSQTIVAGLSGRISNTSLYNVDFSDTKFNQNANFRVKTTFFGHQANLAFGLLRIKANGDSPDIYQQSFRLDNSGSLGAISSTRLSYQNTITLAHNDGSYDFRFRNSLGMRTQYGSLFHNFDYTDTINDDLLVSQDQAKRRGSFSYSNRFWRLFTRFNANYSFDDDAEERGFSGYSLNLTYRHSNTLSAKYDIDYQSQRELVFQSLNLNWTYKASIISANVSHSDLLGFGAGLTARISLGGEPFNTDVFFNSRSLTSNGTLVVRVFLDANSNAIFDAGEELIENVKVISKQSLSNAVSDQDGLAVLKQLGTSAPTDITVDGTDSGNPFLEPLVEGVSIQPRQGFIDYLDFPMIETSEIEGNIVASDENQSAIAYVPISLMNNKNQIVANTKSEYDGYFFFAGVKPGKYTIKLSSDVLFDRRMSSKKYPSIEVSGLSEAYIVEDLIIDPIVHTKVYFAKVAEFNNLAMLNSYVAFLKSNVNHPDIFKLRHYKANRSNKYQLVSEELKTELAALAQCQVFLDLRLKCNAVEEEIPYYQSNHFGTKIAM